MGAPTNRLSRWTSAIAVIVGLGAASAAPRKPAPPGPAPHPSAAATATSPADEVAKPAPPPLPRPTPSTLASPKPPPPSGSLAGCAGHDAVPPLRTPRAACDGQRATETVTIVLVTDMHAHVHRYLPGERSPLSVLRAFAARRRAETGGRVLFLDGGDDLEKGALFDARSEGEATVHLLDHLGLDARTLGNHDFAYGTTSVLTQARTTAFPVLASNVDGPSGFGAKRTLMLRVGCSNIGLFGLVITPYDENDETQDAPYLGAFHVHRDADGRYAKLAEGLGAGLRAAGAHAVIALDHLGMARDRPIIDESPSVDVVLSAHDHFHIGGPLHGKHGFLVDGGTFLPGHGDANGEAHVDEIEIEIDLAPSAGQRPVRLVKLRSHRLADLADRSPELDVEVARMEACFAPGATTPIADLAFPMRAGAPEVWVPVVERALAQRFPQADAWLFERTTYGGIAKGDLSEGPVTPQGLADFAYVEKQKSGGPGYTAIVPVQVTGGQLRALCTAPTHARWDLKVQRRCPALERIVDGQTYTLLIQRRTLFTPTRAFVTVPASFPSAAAVDQGGVEVRDLLIDHARSRGAACLALDRDAPAPCRGPTPALGG